MQEQVSSGLADISPRRLGARRFSLKNVSIIMKLALIVGSLASVSVVLVLVIMFSSGVTAGIRAYLSGESYYSKGQKDSVYYLVRYMHTRSVQDYQKHLDALSIPLGDSMARLEMQKPVFDSDAATRGFVAGGNAPKDIPYLISLFRRFHDTSYMRPVIASWTQADVQIAELKECAREVHEAIVTDRLSDEREAAFLQRIDQINLASGTLQRAFSAQLGQSAREISGLIITAIVSIASILLGAALWFSWRLSREFHANIRNLRNATIKVAKGDLDHRAQVNSLDELGELTMVFNSMIEQRLGAEQELRAATEFREKIMNNVSNGIYLIDMEGRFVMVNRRFCSMTGYAESELLGQRFEVLFPNERIAELRRIFDEIINQGALAERLEAPLLCQDKQVITVCYSSAPFYNDGKIIGVVGAAEDVTERKLHDARIARLANYDTLTGLPNRNLLNDRIGQAVSRASLDGTRVALLYMDLDGFKFINDSCGHAVGDELLKQVARKIQGCISNEDTVARLGGDEFVAMLCDLDDEADALDVSSKILRSFADPIIVDERTLHVTTSIGVSFYPRDGRDPDTLLKYADIAMYRAKDAGRNCMKPFQADMAANAEQRAELEAAIREALDHNDFELHYQPQFDLKSGEICSAEALIRWRHAKLGVIPPTKFIPLAEETGLILQIGDWALRAACRELKTWHQMGHTDLSVAVNISSHQFQQPGFVSLVKGLIDETGVSPASLHLELTEGVMLRDSKAIIEVLKQLKDIGVVMALDDFGTGYSSLAYLRRFPIDIIKIDQSFVLDLIANPEAASIVRAIIAMAGSLNMKTVAEGVETKQQLDFLASHGCDVIQGFYLSRALPTDEFITLLETSPSSDPKLTRLIPDAMP